LTDYDDYKDKIILMANELFERITESKIMAKTMTLELKSRSFELI
jgi:hypothetical protein